jgi:hypothetical protein
METEMTNWTPITPTAYAPRNRIMERAWARCRHNRIRMSSEVVHDWLAGIALALFVSGLMAAGWAYTIITGTVL